MGRARGHADAPVTRAPSAPLAEVDLVLVRHARPVLVEGAAPHEWRLAHGAAEDSRALARSLSDVLATHGRPIDRLLCSREPKAEATAAAMGAEWGLAASVAAGLEEHHRGVLRIVDEATWRATIARLFERKDELVLGEETAASARQRFEAAVRAALATDGGAGGGVTVMVSHATVMTLLLAAPNSLSETALWSSLGMPDALLVRSRDWRLAAHVGPGGARLP